MRASQMARYLNQPVIHWPPNISINLVRQTIMYAYPNDRYTFKFFSGVWSTHGLHVRYKTEFKYALKQTAEYRPRHAFGVCGNNAAKIYRI